MDSPCWSDGPELSGGSAHARQRNLCEAAARCFIGLHQNSRPGIPFEALWEDDEFGSEDGRVSTVAPRRGARRRPLLQVWDPWEKWEAQKMAQASSEDNMAEQASASDRVPVANLECSDVEGGRRPRFSLPPPPPSWRRSSRGSTSSASSLGAMSSRGSSKSETSSTLERRLLSSEGRSENSSLGALERALVRAGVARSQAASAVPGPTTANPEGSRCASPDSQLATSRRSTVAPEGNGPVNVQTLTDVGMHGSDSASAGLESTSSPDLEADLEPSKETASLQHKNADEGVVEVH